ncbi:MAG: DUF5596 domain-containing protein [Oligosphaeraceae bacterium]|nr:DUF5596 domain-containing protein [Oligosphaeraceae bacterium]
MMTAEECLLAVGGNTALAKFASCWNESQAEYPAQGIFFLREDFWRPQREACGLSAELDPLLARAAGGIAASEALSRLIWHTYWRVYRSPVDAHAENDWPEAPALGDDRGLLCLLVGLNFPPLLQEYHAKLGLPASVTAETLQQIRHFCDDNYRRAFNGRPGLFPAQLSWTRMYLHNPYVRLGRLEYCLGQNTNSLVVYRRRGGTALRVLSEDAVQYTAGGYRLAVPEEYHNDPGAWRARLEHASGVVRGNPILPTGQASRESIELPLAEWENVFSRGDACLKMHIPAGGQMSLESCGESLQQARTFFRQHFPQENIKAVCCGSWIFNPALQEIFPPSANLVRFQKELFLFPVPSGPWDGLWFIFLKSGAPDETFPRETTLQQKVLDYLQQGKRWRCGGMFILLDDIDQFGKQIYLR